MLPNVAAIQIVHFSGHSINYAVNFTNFSRSMTSYFLDPLIITTVTRPE